MVHPATGGSSVFHANVTEVVPNRSGFGQVLSSVGNGPLRTRVQYAFDRSVYSLHFVRTGAQIGEWQFDNGIVGGDVGILDGIDSDILDLIGDRFIMLQLLFHTIMVSVNMRDFCSK